MVAAIPGMEVRKGGIVASGGVGVSLGVGVSVVVSVAVGSGVAVGSKAVEVTAWAAWDETEGCVCENRPHAIVNKINITGKNFRKNMICLLSDNSNHNTRIKLTCQ